VALRAAGRVSWLLDTRKTAQRRPGAIGPGRLVLVVGPSGAGKDTLIAGVRHACRDDQAVVFPRRVITRLPSESEANDAMTAEEFAHAVASGAFALWWDAHGNRYGIPSSIDDDIGHGRTVVCNVSRAIVGPARLRYANVAVVLITAPEAVLQARLEARGRASDGSVGERIRRSAQVQGCEADFIIRNTGRPEAGIRRLLNAIRDSGFYVIY
jgi:ribose 1,5-bisphosphokinase